MTNKFKIREKVVSYQKVSKIHRSKKKVNSVLK